jgi:hypothetical protein
MSDFVEWTVNHPVEFFVVLFIQYAIIATFQTQLKRVPLIGYPILLVFLVQDWWMDKLMTVLFMDMPETRGQLVTGRMKIYKRRYGDTPLGALTPIERFRYMFAVRLCVWLNRFDPEHC